MSNSDLDHHPLVPKERSKPPFWKQRITLPLWLWLVLHVVLTIFLFSFMYNGMISKGIIDPKNTQEFSLLAFACFSVVVFGLAVVRKLGALAIRRFRHRQ